MNGVYESLKLIMKNPLQRPEATSTPSVRLKGSSASSLNHEMEELQTIVVDRIDRLKEALKEGEAVVADESQRAEQLVETLRVNIAALEAKLTETQNIVSREESARHKIEESLTAKIHDLQNDVKEKKEMLETRANEINDLNSKIDSQAKQIAHLQLAIEKAHVEAANHVKRAEHLTESSHARIAALESHVKNAEGTVSKKESIIKELEQNLTTTIQDYESQVRNKQELLAGRDVEITDLKSQLKLLTKGIGDMSSFFRQTEALAVIEREGASAPVQNDASNRAEEKPAALQAMPPKVTPIVPEAAREIASQDLFHRITSELSDVTGANRPIASLVVRDHVVALGESMEKFPKARLSELLESLSNEISDENLKMDFRGRLAQDAQVAGGSDVFQARHG